MNTKEAFTKLSDITKKKCETCVVPEKDKQYRCCDRMFCEMVRDNFPDDVSYPWKDSHKVPFMGDSGCVVSPEHRPLCSAFVCNSQLKDRKFRREYERLCEKAKISSVSGSLKRFLEAASKGI